MNTKLTPVTLDLPDELIAELTLAALESKDGASNLASSKLVTN